MGVQLTNEMISSAKQTEKKTGIPASITLGQIMLESGGKMSGGLSGLAYNDKNLFGVKGVGTAGSVSYPSPEGDSGKIKYSQFKKYNSFLESMIDHARILTLPHYTEYFNKAKTVEDFAFGLQSGGYAGKGRTTYAPELLNVIKSNNLTQYDSGEYKFKAKTTQPMYDYESIDYINDMIGGNLNDYLDDGQRNNSAILKENGEGYERQGDSIGQMISAPILRLGIIIALIAISIFIIIQMGAGAGTPAKVGA